MAAGVIKVHVEVFQGFFFFGQGSAALRGADHQNFLWRAWRILPGFRDRVQQRGCGADLQGFLPGQDSPAFRGAETSKPQSDVGLVSVLGSLRRHLEEFLVFST